MGPKRKFSPLSLPHLSAALMSPVTQITEIQKSAKLPLPAHVAPKLEG
jgi:hypothetical protein